jgi:hypothetical protein
MFSDYNVTQEFLDKLKVAYKRNDGSFEQLLQENCRENFAEDLSCEIMFGKKRNAFSAEFWKQ